jgi:hypothetical protein
MADENNTQPLDRRDFMKTSAAAVAGSAVLASGTASANSAELDHRNERPDVMGYTKLGRTNFMCSKLVFGCGAALSGGRAVRLLERAFANGVNHYDVGYDSYYKGSEKALKPFAQKHRDDIWITSKAPARGAIGVGKVSEYTVAMAKADSKSWLIEIENSLRNIGVDYIDAYYLMMVGNAQAMKSEELYNTFLSAKKAGKIGYWGISTHLRAHECMEAAIETGWYDLAMVGITPGGWYDTASKDIETKHGTMKELRPFLDKARAAGIGLVGMKGARHIAIKPYEGMMEGTILGSTGAEPSMFDSMYNAKLMGSGLNPFQRSYAYLLENGMDVVNSDMQNFKHFEENVIAARDSHVYA